VLSRVDVQEKLSAHFVALRLDWEQGNHYKERFGFLLGTGDQMLLDPTGKPIPNGSGKPGGAGLIHGRHGRDTTAEVLDEVLAAHPPHPGPLEPRLEWFLWPSIPCRDGKGRYPAPPRSIAAFARLPIATVGGPIPPALEEPAFLRRHLRQFIWVRGGSEGASRITVERAKDGLKEGAPELLATLEGEALGAAELGKALDRAWLAYMKERPYTARGYLENRHGRWMRGQAERMLREDEEIRRLASAGALKPPGRAAEGTAGLPARD
jgi:hypothetical protein